MPVTGGLNVVDAAVYVRLRDGKEGGTSSATVDISVTDVAE